MRLSTSISVLLCLGSLFGLVASASAQLHFSPTFKRVAMVMRKDVQTELKLSSKQIAAIKEQFSDAIQEAPDGAMRLLVGPNTDLDSMEKGAIKVLEPAQMRRLNEIWIQDEGLLALVASDLRETMKLDKTVREKIDKEVKDYTDQLNQLSMSHTNVTDPEDLKKMQVGMTQLRNKANDRIKVLLTSDQLKAWDALKGPKYEPKKGGSPLTY